MPVAAHVDMLRAQFLASALRPSHPSHAIVNGPSGPPDMKKTLQSKHLARVEPYLRDGVIDPTTYKTVINKIHTECVKESIENLGNNRLLDAPPPKISSSEKSLSRPERSTLSQLRTGQCKRLNDFQHKLGLAQNALCPECLFRRHTSSHIFNCDACPTDLTVRDLWEFPVLVIDFLKSLPSFSFLLPPAPPPPPPPPAPPP